MWPFTKQTGVQDTRLHGLLNLAFQKVKHDTSLIFRWVDYFHLKHQQTDERIAELERQIYYMPKTREEIKHILDSHYSLGSIQARISELHQRIEALESERKPAYQSAQKLVEIPIKTAIRSSLKENIVKKIVKNSKDYVKSIIFATIRRYGEIPASKLREIVVDEKGLCSKSSFYRLLAEIESENEISVMEKGKEKIYLLKAKII